MLLVASPLLASTCCTPASTLTSLAESSAATCSSAPLCMAATSAEMVEVVVVAAR
eukprot:CAMPEP_0174704394 /NCGR_PEP_ID=MMETSP1094-20130205/8003_1 /TAXON_ID=156173 /ORGANISM="Chrysochromulina brevifilum, Strain UTEX LB 985" /LENGTH=54 /DNA_ID=CAMNT_0015902443 /DNA_START=546 /DNA_END=710 /DNA_ORIENTATION=+